ncbi:DNA translocase FtsK 4TM domain-containing protein [Pseudochelatococcus sp. B33]
MRTIRRNSSHADDIPDALRRFVLQRAVELTGFLLLALVIAAVLALMTWSVSDPSLTHATEGRVANLLGTPGAVFADLTMQIFGLGSVALLLPCAVWAIRLIGRRPLPRLVLRLGLWLVGTGAAAAVASALPGTERWPLPSGLGGVVGDALLFGGRGLIGEGGIGGLIVGLCYAGTAILALSAASGFGLSAPPAHAGEDDEDDLPFSGSEDHDEPGWGIVSLGAVVHGLMMLKASIARRFRRPETDYAAASPRVAREPAFGDGLTDHLAAPLAAPLAAHPAAHPSGRVSAPPRAPMPAPQPADIPPEVAAFAPARERPVQIHLPREPLVQPATSAAVAADEVVPLWRRPFQLPPNVRFTRSTDRELAARHRGAGDGGAVDGDGPDFLPAEAFSHEHGQPAHVDDDFPDDDIAFDQDMHQLADQPAIDSDDADWAHDVQFFTAGEADAPAADDGRDLPGMSEAVALPEAAPVLLRHARRPPALAPSNDDDPRLPRPAPAAPARPAAPAPVPATTTTRRVPQAAPRTPSRYEMPPLAVLALPSGPRDTISEDALEQNAALLESTLEDFGVRGDIIHVRPGPVVTLYELEPAPGTKSSRVISLADDIARSMSAVSARVAVVPGRNAIGIELPNAKRETVYLRELLASEEFQRSKFKLALCLGKTIGGEPVIADLARMPHLLVAGTTGSGKSVAINTMIMSLLYRLKPEECRLIMVDPKMLELSIYDGIPHLLSPVVTDPKKAVVALKWAVREMEERYKKMSKLSVRNIDGFNARVRDAKARGEVITRTVQTGFDRDTGEAIYEDEVMDLDPLPYIVIVVDEMADLMMVAGKEIEGTIQRLAQMARAAGIHVILATQRPSVDVITGTIKANFPTRISFQVTSKIDSRTILGEQGAEQLLGQGDMLYMAGGGRLTRVHGPFVSDDEVEKIVAHLKTQGRPQYLEAVTADEDAMPEGDGGAVFDNTAQGAAGGNDLYEQAIAIVLRDKKASTSYIQRRLQIGYNRAASIMERMELEGIVGPANHAGKREILVGGEDHAEHG